MTIHEALARANQKLRSKIDNALTKEVFEAVRDTEIEAIETRVYHAYSPLMYERRRESGGLIDRRNIGMEGGRARAGRLIVTNTTKANMRYPGSTDKTLPELIEYGHSRHVSLHGNGYDFISRSATRRNQYMVPRPFVEETRTMLRGDYAHVSALRKGLKRQGIQVL